MENPIELPESLESHWNSPEGRKIAITYSGYTRKDLIKNEITDFSLANEIYLASRDDLQLIAWQTAAKERIRWLSTQLAIEKMKNESLQEKLKMEVTLVEGQTWETRWERRYISDHELRICEFDGTITISKPEDFIDWINRNKATLKEPE